MTTSESWVGVDPQDPAATVREIGRGDSGILLDFSQVSRIDAAGVRAMEDLAGRAAGKVTVQGMRFEVYRVFKHLGLTGKFSFLV
jgi:anti-anti-sigma regulatory factor